MNPSWPAGIGNGERGNDGAGDRTDDERPDADDRSPTPLLLAMAMFVLVVDISLMMVLG
ncbi:MAG: hypothetical protein ABWZ90_15475 [Acidimicrobiales bacterium]